DNTTPFLVLALAPIPISSTTNVAFEKSIANDGLEKDRRFRPDMLVTLDNSDEKVEPSYRLPVDHIIEKR
ncbi:hypothetical protein, partial [Salmonella enterica]|uniref:hypothetical protein n=1 Tax=Salmonella enterica TaxID=28901 RepID=UPI001ADB5D60